MAGIVVPLVLIALGAAFSFRARGVRDWLERLHDDPRITRHLNMRGYLLGMRLVGTGWLALGLYILGAMVVGPHSN